MTIPELRRQWDNDYDGTVELSDEEMITIQLSKRRLSIGQKSLRGSGMLIAQHRGSSTLSSIRSEDLDYQTMLAKLDKDILERSNDDDIFYVIQYA